MEFTIHVRSNGPKKSPYSSAELPTNGTNVSKAERFIRTCLREWAYARSYPTSVARASALPDFLRYYNQDRFHMGINGHTPMQRLAAHR
jgi:transposase InsO family protein